MASQLKKIKQATQNLSRLQKEQSRFVRRIGGLLAKSEKAARKTQKLETKIAHLEPSLSALYKLRTLPMPKDAKYFRPARLIINTNAGSFAEKIGTPENLVSMLLLHGIQAHVQLKTSSKAVRSWVRAAVKKKETLVIVVGGDGTIEDVALSLVGSSTMLGIIPAGTMNNLARGLGIPLDIEQACALIGAGIIRQIDVGCIHSPNKDKHTYFLESSGLGLAIALPAGQNIKKGFWGKLPGEFRKMFDLSATPTQIELDSGEILETKVKLVTVSNAPLLGLNNLIAPDAKMDDGLFDLAVYDGMTDLELAKYFLDTANDKRVSNPNVHFYHTRRVHICSQQALPTTADKDELKDRAELDFEVIPRAIRVIVGDGAALKWPVHRVNLPSHLTCEQTPSVRDQASESALLTANNSNPQIAEPTIQ